MPQLKTDSQKPLIEKFNELYIMTRKKYLVQFPHQYVTLNKDRSSNVRHLNDGMIDRHLSGDLTYGVFAGGYFNKFITFDVDCEAEDTARWATMKLILVLAETFEISREDIHVSISGGKGYHVDLFFDKPVAVTDLQAFYHVVISEVGEFPGGQIEFRPSWSQGVKLPLGVHQKTGRRCYFCDTDTLDPIKTTDYLLDVEPMPASVITDKDFDLTDEQAAEFDMIVAETNINANATDFSTGLRKAARVLEAGQLVESHTRHDVTFHLARFFLSQGYEENEAYSGILTVLYNTPRNYFSEDSTPDHWRKETKRLVDLVFERGYTFGNADQPVTMTKSEILTVLSAGTFKTKQLLYAMLVTTKRYGQTFYFTESTGKKMLGTKSKGTFLNARDRLIEGGFIEYIRKGELDRGRSRQTGQPRYKPNKYRLLIEEPGEDEPAVDVRDADSVVDVAYMLLTEDEIKHHVKRYEYDSRWKRR